MAQGQTASASGAAVRQTPAAPASPTGNIVALPNKIAVISLQPAIMGTKEGSAAGAALQAKYAPRQAEFEKRKADLAALQDQLRKGGAAMSEDARAKLTREVDSKTKSLQRDAQEASDDSQQDMNSVYNQLGDKMLQIIEQYAYQNGYAVVLDVSASRRRLFGRPDRRTSPPISLGSTILHIRAARQRLRLHRRLRPNNRRPRPRSKSSRLEELAASYNRISRL